MVGEPLAPSQPLTPSQPLATMPQTYQPQPTMPAHTTIHQGNTVAQMEESYGDDGYDYGGYEGEEGYEGGMMESGGAVGDQNKEIYVNPAQVESFIRFEEGSYFCSLCGKQFVQNKSNCKRHILIVHCEAGAATCPLCYKLYRTDQSMKAHMRQTHGICQTK